MTTRLLVGNTYPVYKKLKALGGRWDKEARGWLIPAGRFDEAVALLPPAKRELDPRLKEAAAATQAARIALCALERAEYYLKVRIVLESGTDASSELSFGGWECDDSPVGHCVYDNAFDPRNDCCLFCNEPRERN